MTFHFSFFFEKKRMEKKGNENFKKIVFFWQFKKGFPCFLNLVADFQWSSYSGQIVLLVNSELKKRTRWIVYIMNREKSVFLGEQALNINFNFRMIGTICQPVFIWFIWYTSTCCQLGGLHFFQILSQLVCSS